MSQAKIDEYKKEKANRKANVKKAKTKKKLTAVLSIGGGIIVAGLLIWGIVATIQDGGLGKIKDQQQEAYEQQLATQELIEYLNSASSGSTTTDDTATTDDATVTE